ncbi:sugar ABC transporter permease [Subtercola sp. PAMC28395]|uniref:carbohydrate ABC transporter permease n=1 Tax=Subtercola sp. PAMC28395 TaxID=2846775 RepID=UPI001C0E480C|nr:sugar ABC transporter permease [Subtercola sp. PAMC28395]QWT24163.1 sugar ABC transporter permease [Subtercola sp. PAMC28395]
MTTQLTRERAPVPLAPGFLKRDDNTTWYLLIGVPFALLFLLTAVPLALSLYTSLLDWNLGDPAGATFVGLQNFLDLMVDGAFWHALLLTAYQVIVTVVVQVSLGTCIALLLSQEFKGAQFLRSVYLIPMMTTPVVVGLMWRMLFNTDSGMVNYLLSLVGIGPVNWLGDAATAMPAVIGSDVWLSTPFVVVILLAGLRSIPGEVFEAGQVDGAGGFRMFWNITLPLLKPMILLAVLFRTMDAIRRFDTIYVMTGGGPGNSTETLDLFAYFNAFTYLEVGKGAAIATVMLIIIFLISFPILRTIQRAN